MSEAVQENQETEKVTVTVLPGCKADGSCMLVEVEISLTDDDENDQDEKEDIEQETEAKKKDRLRRKRPAELEPPRPGVLHFVFDHATNEILDACLKKEDNT